MADSCFPFGFIHTETCQGEHITGESETLSVRAFQKTYQSSNYAGIVEAGIF